MWGLTAQLDDPATDKIAAFYASQPPVPGEPARSAETAAGQRTTAHIRIDVGGGMIITSSITNEAVDDLALTVGDDAFAVIKASDVMIAISLPGSQPAGN